MASTATVWMRHCSCILASLIYHLPALPVLLGKGSVTTSIAANMLHVKILSPDACGLVCRHVGREGVSPWAHYQFVLQDLPCQTLVAVSVWSEATPGHADRQGVAYLGKTS